METLHTILLGPYKYLLKKVMPTLNARQRKEVLARMAAFNYSGFDVKVLGNVVHHHQSFVGRDYKAWAQMALFIIGGYIDASQKQVWLALSKVCIDCAIHDPLSVILPGFLCDNHDMMQVVLHYLTCYTFLGVSDSLLFAIQ